MFPQLYPLPQNEGKGGGEGISKKAFSSIAFAKHNIEDPRANISEEAKFVVVGDSKIVIPAFVRKIEELSNEKNLIFSE